MREVGVLEAKTNLSALLDGVERGGEDVIITRNGKPVARLTAPTSVSGGSQVRRLTGEELEERFQRLRDRLSAENPEIDKLTWEDIREMRDS